MTNSLEIRLTTKGLGNLPRNAIDNDFTFVLGSARYACPLVVACFVSPRVCSIVSSDPTVREFSLMARDLGGCFGELLSLGSGGSLWLTVENRDFFREVCGELWNRELFENAIGSDLTIDNALDRLGFLEQGQEPFATAAEAAFCASHFFELDSSRLSKMSLEVLSAICCQDCLRLKTEDSLCEIILNRCSDDWGFSSLLQFIRFEYLSVASIESFCATIETSFPILTPHIFRALSRRLCLPVSPGVLNNRWMWRVIACPFRTEHPLDGVIHHLSRVCGGHVHDHGVVLITRSGVHNSDWESRHIADLERKDNSFISNNVANSWVRYDFKTKRVQLTHYSVRSSLDWSGHYLRSWVLEGSEDGELWIVLDNRENDVTLNSVAQVATFATCGSAVVRHIRLRQVGISSNGYHYLQLSALELFGVLLEPESSPL